jgi:hypothetical protein
MQIILERRPTAATDLKNVRVPRMFFGTRMSFFGTHMLLLRQESVDAFYAAALSGGGTSLEKPGIGRSLTSIATTYAHRRGGQRPGSLITGS